MDRVYAEDDCNLVEACIKRDLLAWSKLVNKYSGLIVISAVNRLKNYGFSLPNQDIEDIKQNVLASLWNEGKLEGVRNRKNISYWLSIVSGNMAIEYIRRKRSDEPVKPLDLMDTVPSSMSSPQDVCSHGEIIQSVEKAIESLEGREKLIAKLNILYGKKYYEISAILNLPNGTVSSYLKRAKEKLRELLKDFR